MRAGLADLRHLQGFLASVGREHLESHLAPDDSYFSHFAGTVVPDLAAVGDRIEAELARPVLR